MKGRTLPAHRSRLHSVALRRVVPALAAAVLLVLTGCGYHTSAHATRLPADLHTLAIPAFSNQTSSYHIEQVLTEAVVREFLTRSHYRVVNQADGSADAVLRGAVFSSTISPVTYDSQTGRVSTALVTLGMKVSLVDRQGKVLYENNAYWFREQYQVSREPSSFFQEESPAMERMSREFARTLVANVLEAY